MKLVCDDQHVCDDDGAPVARPASEQILLGVKAHVFQRDGPHGNDDDGAPAVRPAYEQSLLGVNAHVLQRAGQHG